MISISNHSYKCNQLYTIFSENFESNGHFLDYHYFQDCMIMIFYYSLSPFALISHSELCSDEVSCSLTLY